MRLKLYKAVCILTALVILLSFPVCPSAQEEKSINGILSSVYGYALNDYMASYGVVTSQDESCIFSIDDTLSIGEKGGIVYADLVDFNSDNHPFMVIYLVDRSAQSCEVHLLRYNDYSKKADLIGVISKPYNTITPDCNGEFNIGYHNGRHYISYKTYENHTLTGAEYYTVIGNDAFMYVSPPTGINDIGIMDFNSTYFHSGMEINNYNKALGSFFKRLKDNTADSVTHEDISERLDTDEEKKLEATLSKAVFYCDFDISRFKSMAEYRRAMELTTNSDRFYLITNMYNLGDEIYYVRFSTDRSFYNYTLLRRSDSVENGYQLLKVRTDCIPLSDYELESIYDSYKRNTLLMKKARMPLNLKSSFDLSEPVIKLKLPRLEIEKTIPQNLRTPLALIGGGVSLVILVTIWLTLLNISSDDDE